MTRGTVTAINFSGYLGYDNGPIRFVNQVIVQSASAFMLGGDSGALLVIDGGQDDLKPAGLLFAGNAAGTFAIANRIDDVLAAFGVTIDGA